jgi:protocatechuate 3,4-dioxygenase, beta subunit
MKLKLTYLLAIILPFVSFTGQTPSSQNKAQQTTKKLVGGGCDGCELMFVDMPKNINATDTSAGWTEQGVKLLVTGKVYQMDGKTPAKDVIIYYWQTDHNGYYSPKSTTNKAAQRHGHIRGWVKTDREGRYAIYTIRPAPYPNETIPAHIHISIKEPDIENEYYIDEFVFDDDRLLTGDKRGALENRGGSGILRLIEVNGLLVAEHNIVLGVNIPNYPQKTVNSSTNNSGLQIGEDQPSFIPYHAWGPDKGTRTCPVCKYGRYHGIVYFVGNHPDWADIKKWLLYLETESGNRNKYLKAYFVYGNETGYSKQQRQAELEKIGKELALVNIALTYVPSMTDAESEANLNKIDPAAKNTFVIYRHRSIIDKYVNLEATEDNFKMMSKVLDQTVGDYFQFKELGHD